MAVTQDRRAAPTSADGAGPGQPHAEDPHTGRRMVASIVAVFLIALAGILLVEAVASTSDAPRAPAREVDVDVDPGRTNGR